MNVSREAVHHNRPFRMEGCTIVGKLGSQGRGHPLRIRWALEGYVGVQLVLDLVGGRGIALRANDDETSSPPEVYP